MSKRKNKTIILPHKTEDGKIVNQAYTENKLFNMPTFLCTHKEKHTRRETDENGKTVKIKEKIKVKKLSSLPSARKSNAEKKEAWINNNVGRLVALPLWSKKIDLSINYNTDKPNYLQKIWKVKKKKLTKTALVSIEELERQKMSHKERKKELERQQKERELENIPEAEQEVIDDGKTVEEIIANAPPPEVQEIEILEEDIAEVEEELSEEDIKKAEKKVQHEKKVEEKSSKKEAKKEQKRQDKMVRKAYLKYFINGIIKASPERVWRKPIKCLTALGLCSGTIFTVSIVMDTINSIPYIDSNHDSIDDTFDNSDDIVTDDNNNIIVDPTTPEDKEVLTELLEKKLLSEPTVIQLGITKIDNIHSITRFVQNAFEFDNENDKYVVSIIFESNGKKYCKNYVEGREKEGYTFTFPTDEDDKVTEKSPSEYQFDTNISDKQNMVNFITYLNSCATGTCNGMSDEQEEVLKALQKEEAPGAIFVGNCIETYKESGEACFTIPVYINDANQSYIKTYSVLREQVHGIINNVRQANEKFYDIYMGNESNGEIDWSFTKQDVKSTESLIKILEVIQSFKESVTNPQTKENQASLAMTAQKKERLLNEISEQEQEQDLE
jgi:hypothetical protein